MNHPVAIACPDVGSCPSQTVDLIGADIENSKTSKILGGVACDFAIRMAKVHNTQLSGNYRTRCDFAYPWLAKRLLSHDKLRIVI